MENYDEAGKQRGVNPVIVRVSVYIRWLTCPRFGSHEHIRGTCCTCWAEAILLWGEYKYNFH